jgi:DNA-binding NarL/FixJ family response regulator
MLDVLIVDDHPVMRELLRQVLETYSDLSIVAEAVNGEDAVRQATRLKPAVAIMDVHLPTMSGIEATILIKHDNPSTAIIGLTAGEPGDTDKAMISAGASVVIDKADVVYRLHSTILDAVKNLRATQPPLRAGERPTVWKSADVK